MYSKQNGITRRPSIPPNHLAGQEPAYRQPYRERVQVPPNYSGHAIVDGEERPLGELIPPAPEPIDTRISPYDTPTPRFGDLPRVSELGDTHRRQSPIPMPATYELPPSEEADTPAPPSDGEPAARQEPAPPPPSPRGVSLFDAARFPFGHGIGLEEILILGLILFLLREGNDCDDRGDLDETVILLGLLLLLG